jgi:hypothetical protein
VKLGVTIPKLLSFIDHPYKDILVFGMFNGHMYVIADIEYVSGWLKYMSVKLCQVTLGNQSLTPRRLARKCEFSPSAKQLRLGFLHSGNAAVDFRRNQFIVDNTMDRFSLYQLDTGTLIHTFLTGRPLRRVPKQVAFDEDSRLIVRGSDHSVVYVFDRRSGGTLDVLPHADKGLVQTVMVWFSPRGWLCGINAAIYPADLWKIRHEPNYNSLVRFQRALIYLHMDLTAAWGQSSEAIKLEEDNEAGATSSKSLTVLVICLSGNTTERVEKNCRALKY